MQTGEMKLKVLFQIMCGGPFFGAIFLILAGFPGPAVRAPLQDFVPL
jgi:hypothetical protein